MNGLSGSTEIGKTVLLWEWMVEREGGERERGGKGSKVLIIRE